MSFKLKPVTRLSIIFILAIILSGSILTWFSINNISNLKELTEKRIIEEQRELSERFSTVLQNKIDTITAGLANENNHSVSLKDSLIKRAADCDFVIQPFILKSNGQFIYPNFTGLSINLSAPTISERFSSAFNEGETAEFAEKDSEKAKKYYLSCLDYSTGNIDSVKALNALGRIAVKQNDAENASARYGLIALNYFSVSDENGFPYVYYALPQLLKITGANNSEKIVPVIEFFLENMISGLIPLNFSTEELLALITEWLKEITFNNPEKLSKINSSITIINQQIHLINVYGNELTGLLKKGNWDEYFNTDNDYRLVNPVSGINYEFLLINTNLNYPAGFLMDRNKLFDRIVKADLQEGFDFDYIIEFPERYFANNTGHSLIYSSQLNPYFPGQLIRIKLENENLINDFVKRRSWIYGIASLLLLVAMILGVALILRDIAREKHLARLRSDFISNVTHELKTPLTSIRMYAESLMMGRVKSTSGQKEYLSVVVNESERLKRMINNILEFSKMEKGKQEYHPVESRLSDILLAAIRDMNYWIEEKGFTLLTEIDRDIIIKVDPEKLHQVYTNLLSNAVKYSGDSREIGIRLFRNSSSIITEFEDKGIGIAEDMLPKIFEEFYRVEGKESGEITGTGLGLTVVKEIVEAHGGKIEVESEIGKGSKFSVILYQQ
ncbi:MAG: HAMP domain-containing sensor histidine kinase [Bacteroidales bacterium]|nr:HAMP domain-containing sensor histidine kinase [Bacteroidales bacterium]